jgi:hypothetical protein
MAILQISRIQHRRGLQEDLPQLASAELGWSIDTRKLYIGNGTVDEGAPTEGVTEILTENSILDFTVGFASNITALQNSVTSIDARVTVLESGAIAADSQTLSGASSGSITAFTANNVTISYTCSQGTKQRTGVIKASRFASGTTVSYDEEYTETATTDLVLSMTANSSYMSLNYSTTTATSLLFQLDSLS